MDRDFDRLRVPFEIVPGVPIPANIRLMKRLVFVPLALALLFAWPAAAQNAGVTKQATVSIATPITVGATTLQPGTYLVQHRALDGGTFLVFETSATREEGARVACEAADLPDKVKVTELRTRREADGTFTLLQVRFADETRAHTVMPVRR